MTDDLQQVINFTIKDGKIDLDAEGFNGEGCAEAAEFLLNLGESEIEHKPEYQGGRRQRVRDL